MAKSSTGVWIPTLTPKLSSPANSATPSTTRTVSPSPRAGVALTAKISLFSRRRRRQFLLVMSHEAFARMSAEAESNPTVPPRERRVFLRQLHARAEHGASDKQGRLVLPEDICKHLGLKGEVTLVGGRGRFEIWNSAKWKQAHRGGNGHLPTRGERDRLVALRARQRMNALLFERPVWFATGPLIMEEEAHEMEDFTYHRPVLVGEVIELLAPRPGTLVVDGTCGGGGHAEAILQTGADVLASGSGSGRDRVMPGNGFRASAGASPCVRRISARREGCSTNSASPGSAARCSTSGFPRANSKMASADSAFMRNGPLDMRMDPRRELTAADVINGYSEEELTRIFRELGEEPAARRIASQLVKQRKTAPFRETVQLARAIEKIVWRHGRRHPATQVFQALRMEVNDELGALEEGLLALSGRLEAGARFAVITFHSLEDRIVKNFFRDRSREWLDRPEWPEPRPIPTSPSSSSPPSRLNPAKTEQRANPRSRSAKLRVAEKI